MRGSSDGRNSATASCRSGSAQAPACQRLLPDVICIRPTRHTEPLDLSVSAGRVRRCYSSHSRPQLPHGASHWRTARTGGLGVRSAQAATVP